MQHKERVTPASIVVLTPRAEDDTALADWEAELGLTHASAPDLVLWDTVYRFKGLERPIVILVEVDRTATTRSALDQLLYVAYSRASNRLFVLHGNEVDQAHIRRTEGHVRPAPVSLVDSLDPWQREAVTAPLARALVWAGAGSGKTRVLTRRVAYLLSQAGAVPEQVLAVTFTNKAAREMRRRLTEMLGEEQVTALTVGTFHAICARILRDELPRLPGEQFYDRRAGFRTLDDDGIDDLIDRAIGRETIERDAVKAYIDDQKNNGRLPHQCAPQGDTEQRKHRVYIAYDRLLREQNRLDFNDMLLLAVRLLEQHPGVRSRLYRRYRHILVDEYQDTNVVQHRLVELLATAADLVDADGTSLDDEAHSLMVVGDAQQAIYSWRQAKYTLFTQFRDHYPDAAIFELPTNYRSTARIIEIALVVADPVFTGVDRLEMVPHRRDAALEVIALELDDAEAEARAIAARIRYALDTKARSPNDIVVLLRQLKGSTSVNHTVKALERAFYERRIPWVTQGVQSFYRNPMVRALVACLRVLCDPDDDNALREALDTPLVPGVGAKTVEVLEEARRREQKDSLYRLLRATHLDLLGRETPLLFELNLPRVSDGQRTRLREVGETIATLQRLMPRCPPFGDFLERLRLDLRFREIFHTSENDESYSAVLRVFTEVLDSEVSEHQDLASVLDVFSLYDTAMAESESYEQGKVRVMSIHRSKGLEFPVVFVPALEEGSLPSERSLEDKEQLLEEGRVCYVALTRAQDELILSCVRRRGLDARGPELRPSRYFLAIQQIIEARQALAEVADRPPDYDPFEDQARYEAAPASVVVDTTRELMDVAAWRHLNYALAAVPGAHPVQVLATDDDGRVVMRDVTEYVCGDDTVIQWLRRVTRLPITR